MALRQILLPWDSQPTDGARINGGHWLASSLLFATDGQAGFVWHEPVAPAVRGLASAPVSAAGPLGGIQAWVPDGSGYVRWAIPPRSGNGITLGVWVQGVASTTNDQIFSVSHATSANGGRSIRRTSTELYVANRVNSALSNTGDASAAAATASTWQFVIGTFTSDTASDVWLDGVKGPEGSGNSRPVTTVDSVLVGTVIPNGATFETATTAIKAIGPAYLLDRVLSADEAVLWSQEAIAQPWAMFEHQRIWVPVSAGAGGTTYDVTVAESASADDNTVAAQLAAAAISEAASGADAISSLAVLSAALSEAGSPVDTVTAGAATYAVSLTETSAADDTVAAILQAAASMAEVGSAGDALSSAQVAVVSLSEAASADDAANWGGAIYAVSLAEAASAADAVSRVLQSAAEVAEGASASDTVAAVLSHTGAAVEPADAVDAIEVALQLVAGLAEAGAADDQTSGTVAVVHTVLLLESGVAVDLVWAHPLVVIVPRQRTLFIAAEDRALRIAAEDRTLRIRLP